MSESLNLQKTTEAIAAKTAEQQTEQAPVMAYDMKNRIGDQETREATGASDEESGEVRDEALKKELFGDFFVDMAQYVSVDVRTDMAEQTDLYNKSLSFLNEKRIALKGKLRGEDALVASFSERIMEKIERKKDKILTDVKEGIKAELTGNPQIDAELMKALLDPVSELNDLIRTGGEIFESLEKAFGGNIGAGERQALLDKISITEGVPDEAFYDDVRIAQSILGDIRALQEENLKNTDALIAAENEEIERLTLQKDEIEGQIGEATGLLSEKNETDIRVKYDDATLDEYVPKSALGKISTFTDYKKNKVEGVGKAKAFFDKNKLRGKELKERMEKHVRRFLSARNGVTAESMAKFSNVLMESSGVLAMNTKNERVSEEQTRRMNLLKALYNAGDGDTIASLTIEARRLIRNTDKDDIPFGGEFYRAHPMAAKIIILRKLLYDMDSNALTGASEEYCGRIQALESNVSYLYGAIVGSDEYRLEVLKQKSAKLESEINTHLEKRELLLQRKAEKENTVKTVSGVKTGESEKEALHRKITGLQEREEERARQKRIEDSRKRIADLKKSIDKNNLHAIKSAHAVQISTREPVNSMDMGAAAYMDTLLKENLFKGLDGEDEAFFKKKITEQTARKLQKENKKLEDCTPEEVCGLVKAFELMVNKFLEDKTIKSFLEDCRQMKRSDYRDFALDRMFTGRPFVSFDDYETEHKRIMDNVEEYIALSSVYKPDKRVMLSIKDMKSANNLDRHVRSIARVDRIEGFEDFLRSTLGEENMPLTLYEYASKYYRSDAKNVMDYAESYKGYIERVFGGLGQMTVKKGEFVGSKYSTIADIKDILLKYFCEYGANVNLKGTLEKLGDSLNTKSREKYMPELALIVDESIKHDIEHKSKLVDMCATGSVEKKAETGNIVARFDTRIKSLFDRNKNFSKIIDTLMENEAFKQNIFMMGDDEFEEYIEPIAQKSISVVNELVKHKYFDQYLIERKKTINEYIFENKGTNIVQLLNVEDLDKEIDNKWVGWTKYGKIIHDRIANQGKKDSKLYSLTGTATITILRDSGAAKILSLNEKDMRKAAENLETLDKAIDEIAPYDELFAAGLSVDALRVSLHQLERKELIESSVANYAVGLKERLQGKIKTILDEQEEVIKLGEQRTELSHVIIDVGQRREVGRMAFNKLFRESEEEFAQKDLANLTVEGEYKEILKEVESNAGDFVGDELMESVYTSIVKKMIAHAADDDKETFLRDRHDFLRLHAFCVAAEISVGKVEEMSAFARSMLKRGLFEYFAKTLVGTGTQGGDQAEKPAESVEAFVKMIDDLLGEEAYGSTMASVLTETMEGFVNSDQKFGESRQSSLDRKQFFSSLTEGMDEDTVKLIPAGEEERALLCHVLMTRSGINGLRCALATLTGNEENNKIAIETSNVVMSYITGTGLAGLPLDIDYNLIYSRVLSRPEELKEAISLVADWKKEKEDYAKRTAVKGEDLLSEQLIIGEMKQFRSETDGYKSRIADDTLMSAEDKLWRYYTVLRTYRSTIGKYKELRDNGSAGDPAFDKLLDVYATLQEYFTVGDQSDASALKMFESDICKDLNIYPGLATAREKVDAVRKFRDAQDLIDRRLQGATGDETKKHDTSLLDRNEKCYMPEVLKAVEKVDRWLINTADRWGNSESNFALDILSRPLREKLYLYYVIEQDLAETNEETDTAMAMYSYVPDLDKIMSNLHNHKDYIKNTTGNLLKMIPGVKGKGYFDSWGLVNTSGLEAAMRKLDYEHSSVMTKLKKAEEKKIMAHAVEESVREQKKRGEDVNKAHELFLLREVSYASFLREADKQRELLTKYGEEAQNNEEVKQQTEKVKSALRGLIDSDDSVKELAGELEKAKERNEGLGVSDVSEEVGSFVDLVSDISEQINPFDEEKNEYRYTLPWGLHEQLTAVLEKVDTFCAGASLVTGLIGLVSGIKETREKESTRSALGRTEDIAGNVSDAADFVENVCEFLSCVKESTKDVAETVSGVVTGSVEIATGIVHLVTSGVRMTSVNESRSGAVKFAKTVEQEGGDTEITTKNGLNLSDIIKNVCNVETRIATAEYFNGMFDVCTGILDVAAALSAPAAGAIFEGISAVIGLIKDIHSFMANKNQRETSVDEYLGIDSLYMDFLDCLDKMDEADRVRYGSSESEIKKNLRMMALRHAHFSTTEEYFGDIATQYATIIHRQIFTVKGRPIMAGDQKEIAEREVLRNLFKGTAFTYPEKEGDEPSPTPEQLAEEICRTVD